MKQITVRESSQQEVFNKIVTHLRKQGKRSVNEYNKCVYRGLDGRMCAVGCLIPDENYKKGFDKSGGVNIGGLFFDGAFVGTGILPKKHLDLLISMQRVHDKYSVEKWEEQFKAVAENRNLVLKSVT